MVRDAEFAAHITKWLEHSRQKDLAHAVAVAAGKHDIGIPDVSRSSIRRWSKGHAPDDLYAILIAEVTGVKVTELGSRVGRHLTPDRVQEVLSRAAGKALPQPRRDRTLRSDLVLELESAPTGTSTNGEFTLDWERMRTMLQATERVNQASIDDLHVLTTQLVNLVGFLGPRIILPELCSHIVTLRARLITTDRDSFKNELARMAGQTAIAAGLLWHALHDLGEANEAYGLALELGQKRHDNVLIGLALASKALLAARRLHEEGLPAEREWAITLMAEAERALSGAEASPEILTWLYCSRAWESASRGDGLSAGRDLDAAHRAVARMGSRSGFFLLHDTRSQVMLYQAKCALLLGKPADAVRLMEQAFYEVPNESPAMQSWLAAELAGVLLQAREFDRAVALLGDVWRTAVARGITKFARRVQRYAYQDLEALRARPDVRALREQIASDQAGGWGLLPGR